ncbi:hypothetical protein GF342_04765 [Candidatus Woesearchaeota archaeon]|nr:hypothetical protein [Candidatus Woesearchaeota archaeon]
MVSANAIVAVLFIIGLSIFLYRERKKIEFQRMLFPILYFVLLRTKLGLKFFDWCAERCRRPLIWAGYAGIVVGFLGMAAIAFELVYNSYRILTEPAALSGVGLVLPFEAQGVFYVPFIYWIVCIFIIAVIHEASHGILARAHKIPVKSSGFAFLGVIVPVIPAAFVEPDEKKMKKRPDKQQLSVFAAGPFSNIITGILFLLVFVYLFLPAVPSVYESTGIEITQVVEDGPVAIAGIEPGTVITSINDKMVLDSESFFEAVGDEPLDEIMVGTDKGEFMVRPEQRDNRSYFGIFIAEKLNVRDGFWGGQWGAMTFSWLMGLFQWLALLSLGIGLFNLVPLGPVDGGRMFKIATNKLFKEKGDKIWASVSWLFLALILFNVIAGFL